MANLLKRAVQAAFPDRASAKLERNWQAYFPERPDARSPTEIFSEIYRNNWWGGQPGELYSGSGSSDEISASFVQTVRDYIEAHGLRRVVDLGCGDFRVGAQLLRPGLTYTGVDVVPDLVESHQRTVARAGVEFVVLDIVDDELPDGDLYLLRQVLQHLSNAQIGRVLVKLRDKPHVIIAEHHPAPHRLKRPNRDKPAGRGIRVPFRSGVYPDRAPFSFPCRVIATHPVPPLIAPGEVITTYAKV
jgi:SAM-dependent methyltransferase